MATLSPATLVPSFHVRPRSDVVRWRVWLGVILLAHLLLGLWYSVIIPPWEAHDEWAHFRYAAHIAETRTLPDPNQRLTTEFLFDEATQPPLYYLLAAAVMLPVDTQDGYRPVVNPYAARGTGEGGVNFVLHDPQTENWPWRGTILALHLGRLVSVLISLAGLFFTFRVAQLLSPQEPEIALIATGVQAFTPQYVFLSAVMTNDILLVALASALLYYALRLVQTGGTARLALTTGAVLALALLTKYLALALAPVALAALILAFIRRDRTRTATHTALHSAPGSRTSLLTLLALLAPFVLVGGWWLSRNIQRTGLLLPRDPVAQNAVLAGLQGQASPQLDWGSIPGMLIYGFKTYWVSFGWGNVGTSDWVYLVWLGVTVGAGIGLAAWLRTRPARENAHTAMLAIAAIFVLSVVALPLLRELLHSSQFLRGRYILSTLPLAAWSLAQGWAYCSRWRLGQQAWPWLQKLLIAWPAALTLALGPLLILPAYAPPTPVHPGQSHGEPLAARFGDAAELLKASVGEATSVTPGEGLAITLTWRVLARTTTPQTLALHLVSPDGQVYGRVTSYPGHGNAATTVWEPGVVFSETHWMMVEPNGPTPVLGQITVALFQDDGSGAHLPVFDAVGAPIGGSVRFGQIRIERPATAPVAPLSAVQARFGDALALLDAQIPAQPQSAGWTMPVVLRWQALGPADPRLTLTVQLLDANGQWIAGNDGPPTAELPPQLWVAGDRLHTTLWLLLPSDLPPGRYQVVTALYDPAPIDVSFQRLPVYDGAGQILPAAAWSLGEVVIE